MCETILEFKPVEKGEIIHTVKHTENGLEATSRRSDEEFERYIKDMNIQFPKDRISLSYGHACIRDYQAEHEPPAWLKRLQDDLS